MSTFTLDDIKNYATKKYADVTIDLPDAERESGVFTVTMLNPLRLSKEAREELKRLNSLIDEANGSDDVDEEAAMRDVLRVVCDKPVQGERLNAALTDLTMVAAVFDQYAKATQAGEA